MATSAITYTTGGGDPELDAAFERALATAPKPPARRSDI